MAVDLAKLMKGVASQLEGKVAGYAVAIYKGGVLERSTSGGWAVIGEKKFDSNVRMSMGSMGKTISAAAIVRALQTHGARQGLDLNNSVSPWLPDDWKPGPNADRLTLRDILTHTSGIRVNQKTTFNDLKARYAKGLPSSPPAPFEYSNANYDLTRIVLPPMCGVRERLPGWAERLGAVHIDLVKRNVLEPCGLKGIDVIYTGPPPRTRYYEDFPATSRFNESNNIEEARKFVGAGWWTMSAREYGLFIDRLRHESALPGVWRTMRDTRARTAPDVGLGLFRVSVPDGDAFWHNGGYAGGGSAWVALPKGVTVVVCANSTPLPAAPQNIILTSYSNALS